MLSRTFAIRLDSYFKNEIITSCTFASTTKNYLSLKRYTPIFDATVFLLMVIPLQGLPFLPFLLRKL